jgi:isopenicillin N synthase-like dioxygenase
MTSFAPVIDLSPYISGGAETFRVRTARAIDAAMSEYSAIQIIGHGIPSSVFEGLTGAMDDFFALDDSVKRSLTAAPAVNRGYTPPYTESLAMSLGIRPDTHDAFEAFNVGASTLDYPHARPTSPEYTPSIWPHLPGFQRSIDNYFNEAGRLTRDLIGILGESLGLGRGFLESVTDHSIDTMRLNKYVEPGASSVGMGAHTDYGITTVLWADALPGLEIAGRDGQWHSMVPQPGALIVLVGELLARLTNDKWLPTLHRVVPSPGRRSVTFFHDGNASATIAPIPSLIAPGETAAYPAVTVQQHIAAKLAGSRGGVPFAGAEHLLARLPRE